MEKRDEENCAVDAIVATSEPQVPKPRTKKPEAEKKKKKKKNEKKNCSLEVGKTNAELPGDTCQRSSQTLIHSPVVKADRCRLSHPPPACVRAMALAAACVCASRKVALWVHATAHPLLLRRTHFPSEPRVFFLFFPFFSKFSFSFKGFVSPTIPSYLFIYLFII
jgi:hypothetical protein